MAPAACALLSRREAYAGRIVSEVGKAHAAEGDTAMSDVTPTDAGKPRITITYCTQCHWLLRAAWMAQELLSTFSTDLGEVALVPGAGGVFRIDYGGEVIWERVRDEGFPDIKTLKQRVRDLLDPERNLGHIDRH